LDRGTISLPQVDAQTLKSVSNLISRYGVWRDLVLEGRYALVIAGVEQWIVENLRLRSQIRDVNDLHAAAEMIARMKGSLSQRVHLFQAPKDDKNEDKGGVQLLTMHSAKGLECDKTAVIQVIDGTCPSANAGNVNKERRLMYVAITRARDQLYVSSVASRPASPFILV
jgi:superfamily I DNA/RNA helicase